MPRQSYEAIRKQIEKLQAQALKIEATQGEKKKKAVGQVVALMRKLGVTPDDLGSHRPRASRGTAAKKATKKSASRKPVAPKFRNTKTGDTWSGRGRTPRWLVALEAQGKSREDYRI